MKILLPTSPNLIAASIALAIYPAVLHADCQGSSCGSISALAGGQTRADIDISADNVAGLYYEDLTGTAANGDFLYYDISTSVNTQGNNSQGISAKSGIDVTIDITSSGVITTQGNNSAGILASGNMGYVSVVNHGEIITNGNNSSAIVAESTGVSLGFIQIVNTARLAVKDAEAIVGRANNGNIYVIASGEISAGHSASTNGNHGVDTSTQSAGEVNTILRNGTIAVINGAGGTSIGVRAWDGGSGASDVDAHITIGTQATVDAKKGATALEMQVSGNGTVEVADDAAIYGGSDSAINLRSSNGSAIMHRLNNQGQISSISDKAVFSDLTTAGSLTEINNSGAITGYITMSGSGITFNNRSGGVWNLRHFFDSDGDGAQDKKGVAVADFGGGNAQFNNEDGAVLRLSAVSGDTLPAANGGEYLSGGAVSIAQRGIVQGQLLNLNRFENRGVIDLTENNLAGDVLVITGSASAGGGGNTFIADGGQIHLDTLLNDGGANSVTDMLVLDDVQTGAGGATGIVIKNVGGSGALTRGDGIKIIEVHGTSAADSFKLDNVVKGGIYEYTLFQGSLSAPADYSWYLRSSGSQLNPDIGSYLGNQRAATTIFMHGLHDRTGESSLSQRKSSAADISSVWLRSVMGHSKNRAASGTLDQSHDSYLIHLGGDVAQWQGQRRDSYHLGVMGAYGRSETKTRSEATDSQVKANLHGYGAGLYFSWLDNLAQPEGWYSDIWSMYSWFDNETESVKKYRSRAWTSSLEVGYAFNTAQLGQWLVMMEPHGQAAYTYYHANDLTDSSDMAVTGDNANGVTTRLGGRVYLRDKFNHMNAQPFIEANWLYSSVKNSLKFDGLELADDVPKHRFETKIGVQGNITDNVHIYSHIGLQWGKSHYENSEGQLGLKFRF
jgi:autotransporter family porin